MDKDNAAPSEKFLSGFGTSVGGGTPAYRRYAREAQKCYKPISTRFPFLCGVVIITLSLIAIVEIVLRQYPVDDSLGELAITGNNRRAVFENSGDEDVGINDLQYGFIKARAPTMTTNSVEETATTSPESDNSPSTSSSWLDATTSASVGESTSIPIEIHIPTAETSPPIASVGDGINVVFGGHRGHLGYVPPERTSISAYIPPPETSVPIASVDDGIDDAATTNGWSRSRKPPFRTVVSAYIPPPTTTVSVAFTDDHRVFSDYAPSDSTAPGDDIPVSTTIQQAPPGDSMPTSIITPQAAPPSVATTITLPNGPQPSQSGESGESGGGEIVSTSPDVHDPGILTKPGVEAQVSNIPTSTIDDPMAFPTSMVPISTLTSGGAAVVLLGTPSKPPLVPVSTFTSNGVAMVVMGSTTEPAPALVPISTFTSNGATMIVMGSETPTSLVPISTVTSNGVAVVVLGHPSPQPVTTDISQSGSGYSVLVEPVTSTSGGIAYVYMTTLTLGPASQTSTAGAPQNTALTAADQQNATLPFTNMSYFAASYLPTIVAVAFRFLWTMVYNNARVMEPFYRLASPSGVIGKHFLDTLYLSMGSIIPEPILALRSGHSYMLLVSTIAYLIELVAPLSAELLAVDVHHGCIPSPLASPLHPCPARIIVHLVPARLLQGLLCLIVVLIILTMFLGRNCPSGVYSDPSSIAAMASLLHHPDILQDLRRLDADGAGLERDLNEQTYRLTHYQAKGEGMKYGIVPTTKIMKQDASVRGAYSVLENPEGGVERRSQYQSIRRHIWRILGDASLAVLMLGSLGIAIGYYLDTNDDGFNRFFNNETFGPKFIVVFGAGIAVSQWKRLEKEVRTLQPYRRLSASATSPLRTILLTTTASPWATLPLAISRYEFFVALIAFCYILSEILVIVVATIPFSTDEYWMAYFAGTFVTISILGLQILAFIVMMTWWRWTGPNLARDPDTLLGVWTLLAVSDIREDFDDLGTAGRKDLVNTVMAWDKRYWLGEVAAKDGIMRMGIQSETDHDDGQFLSCRGERCSSLPPTLPQIVISPDI